MFIKCLILKNMFPSTILSTFVADKNASVFSYNIYMAGTETTATAVRWALLYMCMCPEVKSKVQTEIDDQIGKRQTAPLFLIGYNISHTYQTD